MPQTYIWQLPLVVFRFLFFVSHCGFVFGEPGGGNTGTVMHHCVYAAGPTNKLLKRACFKAYVCSNKVNQINILSVMRLFRETRERHWCFNAVVPIRSPCTSADFDAKHVFFYSGPKQKSSTNWCLWAVPLNAWAPLVFQCGGAD